MTPRRYFSVEPPPFARPTQLLSYVVLVHFALLPSCRPPSTSALPLPGPAASQSPLAALSNVRSHPLSVLSTRLPLALADDAGCARSAGFTCTRARLLPVSLFSFEKSTVAEASDRVMLHDAPTLSFCALLGVRRRRGLPRAAAGGRAAGDAGAEGDARRAGAARRGETRASENPLDTGRGAAVNPYSKTVRSIHWFIPRSSRGSCVRERTQDVWSPALNFATS